MLSPRWGGDRGYACVWAFGQNPFPRPQKMDKIRSNISTLAQCWNIPCRLHWPGMQNSQLEPIYMYYKINWKGVRRSMESPPLALVTFPLFNCWSIFSPSFCNTTLQECTVAWCNKYTLKGQNWTRYMYTVAASCITCPWSTFCLIPGLCFSFASSESKRIHSIAMATGVTTALKTAEERLKSLSWETNPPSTDIMRWDTSQFIEENAGDRM